MFPRELAEGAFTLKAGKPCSTVSVAVILAADGAISEYSATPSTVKLDRLTYDEVDSILLATTQQEEPMLWALKEVTTKLCANSQYCAGLYA